MQNPIPPTSTTFSKPCGSRRCKICPHVIHSSHLTHNGKTYHPNETMTCSSTNLIYILKCDICQAIYVGQTTQFRQRFWNHKNRITHKHNTALSNHFNQIGHTLHNLKIFFLERINPQLGTNTNTLLLRGEAYWINELNTFQNGLNMAPANLQTTLHQPKITDFFPRI